MTQHYHTYQFYPFSHDLTIVGPAAGGWFGILQNCPSGHYLCQMKSGVSTISIPIPGSVQNLTTSQIGDSLHHTHQVKAILVLDSDIVPRAIPGLCASGHTDCYSSLRSGWFVATSISAEQYIETLEPSWHIDGGGKRYHYHLWEAAEPEVLPTNYLFLTGSTACPLGHARCKWQFSATRDHFDGYNGWQVTSDFYSEDLSPREAKPVQDIVTLEAIRNIEMGARGRFYIDEEGNAKYESRYARNP
jgi:hypothetical protein